MKYLCLFYHEEAKLAALSACERSSLTREASEIRDHLRESGHEILSSALRPACQGVTIRVRYGALAINAASCDDEREQLSGFSLIEARDLNEAVRIASLLPSARVGSVEIRPLQEDASATEDVALVASD